VLKRPNPPTPQDLTVEDSGDILQAADENLMAALGFTPEDLVANRQGYMTNKQRRQMKIVAWRKVIGWIIFAFFFAAMCFVGAYAMVNEGFPQASGALMIACIAAGFILVSAVAILRLRQVRADLDNGDVTSISGHLVGAVRNTGRKWEMRPAFYSPPIALDLPQSALTTFQQGETYRVYFLPKSELVLSAEHVPSKPDTPE
jgi:hypothetical protein